MNCNLLRAEIVKHGDTQARLAQLMGLQVSALSMRMSGKIEFRRNEILFIKNRYGLTAEETERIFFEDAVSA